MAGSLRSSRPLAGVEVLDVGTYIAGPLAATHLAHLGANVTCVRRPPNARGAAQEALYRPHMHAALTRGKRVVTLDLPVERDRFVSLLKTADVIITNYPASCAARLGVDAQSCSRVRPEVSRMKPPLILGVGCCAEFTRRLTAFDRSFISGCPASHRPTISWSPRHPMRGKRS